MFKYQQDLARYQSRVDNLRSPGIQDVNQKYLDALKRALEQADGLDKVFARHITNKSGKYIVFCSGKEHMAHLKAMGCGFIRFTFGTKLCNLVAELHFFALI